MNDTTGVAALKTSLVTGESHSSYDDTSEAARAAVDFHWCRHTLPRSVMVASTVITALLSLAVLNAMNGATYRYSRSQLRRMFYPTERKIAFLQYALFMPLFELCVIWGAEIGVSIDDNSAAIVVAWLAVNALCLLVMSCSCAALGSYRLMIHAVQCFRMPLALIFMCDRVFNSVIGVESIFIALMFLCSVFEFFHVQDYFSVYSNSRLDPLGYRNNRKPSSSGGRANDDNDNDDDASFTDGPVLPTDAERTTGWLAVARKRTMREAAAEAKAGGASTSTTTTTTVGNGDKGGVYFSASEDEDASVTELDDRVPANVRSVLNTQKTAGIVNKFFEDIRRFTPQTDAERIKRKVLRFQSKFASLSQDDRAASSSNASRESEF